MSERKTIFQLYQESLTEKRSLHSICESLAIALDVAIEQRNCMIQTIYKENKGAIPEVIKQYDEQISGLFVDEGADIH